MQTLILTIAILGNLLSSHVAYAESPISQELASLDTYNQITQLIASEAKIAGVDPKMAIYIAESESKMNPNAVGDYGHSFGLWQIYLPAHKDITKEQALDPMWSTEWAMNQFKKGNCKIWTTWKNECPTRDD